MKLKTLKNLDDEVSGWIEEGTLKQEAIKWYWKYKIMKPETKEQMFIKKFFNLTEEDLK